MDGEVSRKTFDDSDDKTKLGILFDRTEYMLEQDRKILNRLDSIDCKLRKQSFWNKGFSAVGGFFGGLVSSISILIWRV